MAFTFSGFKTNGNFALVCPNPPPPTYYLWSWGRNLYGRLGDGTTINKSSPVQIGASASAWLTLSSGSGSEASGLSIKTDGTLWSWGYNNGGQLGLGNTTNTSSPVQIGAGTTWSSISQNSNAARAIKTDGTMWSWGYNYYGNLGLGNTTYYSSPKQIGALTTWSKMGSGLYHSLAIKTDGTMWVWGANFNGRLGLGDSGSTAGRSSPVQIGALTTWSNVAGGDAHSVAIKTDGTLWSWGSNNSGELGLGNTTSYSSPKQVGAGTTWSGIACNRHTLALKTDGTMWAWGSNAYGQLGDGTATTRLSPVQIGALTTWLKISAGGYGQSMAIKTDGTLWSWGRNEYGQLGLGDTANRSGPAQIGTLTTWLSVSAGDKHTIAIGPQ